jgi:uncharacterized membrane protein
VDTLFVIIGVIFGLGALALPIGALVVAFGSRSRARKLESDIAALRARIVSLEGGLQTATAPSPGAGYSKGPAATADALSLPANAVEVLAQQGDPDAPPPGEAPAGAAQVESPPPVEMATTAGGTAAQSPEPSSKVGSLTGPPVALAAAPHRAFDWENVIGVRLFAWLGGAALFIGVALFLSYSIQHELISPTARVAAGLLFGAFALSAGDRLRARADFAGQALSGAGVAILYACLFAASSLYHLVGATPAFLAMAFVTAVAGTVAVRRRAFMLAILGLVGGMATPFLLSTGEDRPIALFAYVVLLDIGVVAVAQRRRWPVLGLIGLVGSAVLFLGWAAKFLDAARVPFALVAAAILAALFAFSRWHDEERLGPLPRATVYGAAGAPILLALVIGSSVDLAVAPAFLVAYLLLLLAGVWVVSRRLDVPALMPIAAAFATMALDARVRPDVFPAEKVVALALFALLPAAFIAAWLSRRGTPQARPLRIAAAITLAGSILSLASVLSVEGKHEPIVPLALFVAVHAAGLVVIGALDSETMYAALGQGTEVVSLLLLLERFQPDRVNEFLPVVAVPMVAFWSLPLVTSRLRRDTLAWISGAAALVVHFPILYFIARASWGSAPLGFIAVCCAALALVMHLRARATVTAGSRQSSGLTALLGGETLLFLTAAVPILLNDEWITVTWALEAAALGWLNRRIPHRGLVITTGALASAAFVRLVFNPAVWEYHPRMPVPVLNFYLYAFGVPAAAFLVAARQLVGDDVAARFRLRPLLGIAAAVLLFVLLNVEIADAYSTGSALTFQFAGGGLEQDMTYSLAWGVFALAMLILGIVRKRMPIRIGALGVLTLTIGKVFLHDLWELGSLYRVGSMVGLAMALLAVSFLTQRFVLRREAR